jgi:hypothetical protein
VFEAALCEVLVCVSQNRWSELIPHVLREQGMGPFLAIRGIRIQVGQLNEVRLGRIPLNGVVNQEPGQRARKCSTADHGPNLREPTHFARELPKTVVLAGVRKA